MFLNEMRNHEAGINGNLREEVISACGLNEHDMQTIKGIEEVYQKAYSIATK